MVSFETLEHISAQEQFLSEIKRVLKPGGWLLISTPDKIEYGATRSEPNPFHVRELTQGGFTELLTRHFKHVRMAGQRILFGSAIAWTDAPEGKTSPRSRAHSQGQDPANRHRLSQLSQAWALYCSPKYSSKSTRRQRCDSAK